MLPFLLKTTLLFIIIATSILSYSLPTEEKFKTMCRSIYENVNADILHAMLQQARYEELTHWISHFNKYYQSPLVYAIYSGNLPIIKVLLNECKKLGLIYYLFTKSDGTSMLTIATKENNNELVELLLENKHPVKLDAGYNSVSALHIAAIHNNITAFKLLFQHQKDGQLLHQKDHNGFTPINYLIENSQQELVIELLKLCPVDTNEPPLTKDNMNYLHYAVLYEMHEVIALLLQQGMNYKQKSTMGLTPRDMSKMYRDKHIEKMFIAHLKQHNHSRLNMFNLSKIREALLCCYTCRSDEYSYLY